MLPSCVPCIYVTLLTNKYIFKFDLNKNLVCVVFNINNHGQVISYHDYVFSDDVIEQIYYIICHVLCPSDHDISARCSCAPAPIFKLANTIVSFL